MKRRSSFSVAYRVMPNIYVCVCKNKDEYNNSILILNFIYFDLG